jgi:hypothetical protein
MLIPHGWQGRGGCRWLLDNPAMPAVVAFEAAETDGPRAFEILPNVNFAWDENPINRALFPIGSRYFGAEVRPPMPISSALRTLVLPRYRSGWGTVQVIGEESLPDLPRLARSEAPAAGGWAEGGKVRIRATRQGTEIEEEIYGVVEAFRLPGAAVYWLVDFMFSFRAAAGELEKNAGLFGAMIGSFRLNPHWYAAFKSIAQVLAQRQIQCIQHIGQVGQIYAQTGREIREQNLRDWTARQETYDRLASDRSRAIRGVEGFVDPHRQEVVELPSGYGHAWANGLGEYIVTESADFNPNVGSNLHWERMEQG